MTTHKLSIKSETNETIFFSSVESDTNLINSELKLTHQEKFLMIRAHL